MSRIAARSYMSANGDQHRRSARIESKSHVCGSELFPAVWSLAWNRVRLSCSQQQGYCV
jgi:hypothetical protein